MLRDAEQQCGNSRSVEGQSIEPAYCDVSSGTFVGAELLHGVGEGRLPRDVSTGGPRRVAETRGLGKRGHGRYRRRLADVRSEEHTSELQSLRHLVCRLLLEKKKKKNKYNPRKLVSSTDSACRPASLAAVAGAAASYTKDLG